METMREAKYNAAIETHKHCDTVSMALVTGMIVTGGFSASVFNAVNSSSYARYSPWVFVLSGVFITVLYRMYLQSSKHARIARNVARCLEFEDGYGISHVLFSLAHGEDGEEEIKNIYGVKDYKWRNLKKDKWNKLKSIKTHVGFLWFTLVLIMIGSFCLTVNAGGVIGSTR